MTRRAVHPVAWWLWGVLLAAAALRMTNPWLCGLLIGVTWLVVAARRQNAPWARSFGTFLRIGLVVMVVRTLLQVLFAPRIPGHELFALPSIGLPEWAAGVVLGGPVTAEAVLTGLYESLRLLALLAAVGAANSLADPYRLLRTLPGSLYAAGVATTVALSFAPQASSAAGQVRDARTLRGRPTSGLAGLRGLALPVLEGALDQSVALAASMDARGFGRRGDDHTSRPWLRPAMTTAGLLAVAVGIYGVLDNSGPTGVGLPSLVVGALLLVVSISAGSRIHRTRYRPDPWLRPEWLTVASGAVALAGIVVAGHLHTDLAAPIFPLAWPGLPLLPAVAVAVAALPAVVTPEPPS